jgi:hypothetical protein
MADSPSTNRFLVRFADGTEIGPLDKKSIRALARAGKLSGDDSIGQVGSSKWVAVSQIPGLMPSDISDYASSEPHSEVRPEPPEAIHRPPSSDDDSPAGLPKSLLYGLGGVAVIVIISTVALVVVQQQNLDLRVKARDAIIKAIEIAESTTEGTNCSKAVDQIEYALNKVNSDIRFSDTHILERIEALRPKLFTATAQCIEERIQVVDETVQRAISSEKLEEIRDLANQTDVRIKELHAQIESLPSEYRGQLVSRVAAISKSVASARQRAEFIDRAVREREATVREQEAAARRSEAAAREKEAAIAARQLLPKGKLRVTATYFFNDFKGNVPNEAAIFAIPADGGLQGQRIPGNQIAMLDFKKGDKAEAFMKRIGGDVAWAGGDGRAELRLSPGEYQVVVLMDVRPYFSSDLHGSILSQWFSPEFSRSHGILGRYAYKNVTVISGDTTELSLNLK